MHGEQLFHAAASERGIAEQARRIGEVVKRLRQIEQPRSVEYLGNSRMLDIGPATEPKKS